jgi:hypothetical protein
MIGDVILAQVAFAFFSSQSTEYLDVIFYICYMLYEYYYYYYFFFKKRKDSLSIPSVYSGKSFDFGFPFSIRVLVDVSFY